MRKEDLIVELLIIILKGILLVLLKCDDDTIIQEYKRYSDKTIKLAESKEND